MQLNQSRILLTGASSGIGAATARPLLQKGARLVVLDPDVAQRFPDTESVNNALRTLIKPTPGKP